MGEEAKQKGEFPYKVQYDYLHKMDPTRCHAGIGTVSICFLQKILGRVAGDKW